MGELVFDNDENYITFKKRINSDVSFQRNESQSYWSGIRNLKN